MQKGLPHSAADVSFGSAGVRGGMAADECAAVAAELAPCSAYGRALAFTLCLWDLQVHSLQPVDASPGTWCVQHAWLCAGSEEVRRQSEGIGRTLASLA